VRHKVEVLHRHCAAEDRDPAAVRVTHLSTVDLRAAGVRDQIGRFRELAEAGVQTAIVSAAAVDPAEVERLGEVVATFG
jgi:hypothetical protein